MRYIKTDVYQSWLNLSITKYMIQILRLRNLLSLCVDRRSLMLLTCFVVSVHKSMPPSKSCDITRRHWWPPITAMWAAYFAVVVVNYGISNTVVLCQHSWPLSQRFHVYWESSQLLMVSIVFCSCTRCVSSVGAGARLSSHLFIF